MGKLPAHQPRHVPAEPSRPRERLLVERWRRHRDVAARDELVARMLPLAHRVAARYRRGTEPLDDLVQVAVVGLVKAIDRYDPARGCALSTYAVPTMLGELKRHFRDHGWAVHVPRGLQERVLAVDQACSRLQRVLGRAPSAAEVAAATGLAPEDVVEALEASVALEAVPLDAGPHADGDDGGATYAERVGAIDGGFERAEHLATLAPALRALPERERVVLHLRFTEDLTQAEIAARVGISQMHVSRLLRRSLERLQAITGASAG